VPEPLVTVVVPVFGGERFLRSTLASALTQTHPRVEVIVVDDCSPDRSAEIASAIQGVRVLRQEHGGVASARNAGVMAGTGEFIAFLDQDDEWRPDKLARQLAVMSERPELGLTMTHVEMVLLPGTPRPDWFEPAWLNGPQPGFVPSTWVLRRETFDRIGPLDPSYEIASDSDWLTRAKDAGVGSLMLPEVLVRWRVHGANGSYDQDTMRSELLRMLRGTARRQRQTRHAG
jgi:glycosyltransferase involved in cell wall biosynthesis